MEWRDVSDDTLAILANYALYQSIGAPNLFSEPPQQR